MWIELNGRATEIPTGQTVAQLVTALQMKPQFVAVEINRELIPRARCAEHVLCDGDRVEIVTLVGGG